LIVGEGAFEPLRSLIMLLVALVALWLGQGRRIFHALAAAALDISFQLSFVSVLAIAVWIVWFQKSQTDDDNELTHLATYRVWRWLRDAFVMSGIVTIATLPLVA